MSRPRVLKHPDRKPLIALIERANRAMQADMLSTAHAKGHRQLKPAHNAVFGTLPSQGARAADMAANAGITRQSMGEAIRDMVELGLLEMVPDPADGRAKLVRFTEHGMAVAQDGFDRILELEDRFAEEFGAEEYDAVREFLDRMLSVLKDMPTDT